MTADAAGLTVLREGIEPVRGDTVEERSNCEPERIIRERDPIARRPGLSGPGP